MDIKILDMEYISSILKPRARDCNKGDFGKLLCVVGCKNMSGAGAICARGALRSGVGICTVASTDGGLLSVHSTLPEALTFTLKANKNGAISRRNIAALLKESKKYSAMLLGCGLSVCKDTETVVRKILKDSHLPIILDADGINIAAQGIDILKSSNAPLILTPHVKEMSRLSGLSVSEIKQNPVKVASEFAKTYNSTVILKDFETIIATSDGEIAKNTGGHPCMAKGGSGDMLAGMVASFVAQGYRPFDAACMAVFMHAKSGELCGNKMGDHSPLTSDMLEKLPEVFCSF